MNGLVATIGANMDLARHNFQGRNGLLALRSAPNASMEAMSMAKAARRPLTFVDSTRKAPPQRR
jgi:hypothetical protein